MRPDPELRRLIKELYAQVHRGKFMVWLIKWGVPPRLAEWLAMRIPERLLTEDPGG